MIGVFIITVPYWIINSRLVDNSFVKFSIEKLTHCMLYGIKTGILTAIIGTLFIMIILISAEYFSRKTVALGLLLVISLLSMPPNNIIVFDMFRELNILKSPLAIGLICGLNPISIISILYFVRTNNRRIKFEVKSYTQIALVIFIMKFLSGFIAYGQFVVTAYSNENQPLGYFYRTFGMMNSHNPEFSAYTDPMTAGVIVLIMGIVIVLGMIGVSKLLEDEEASNFIWLGILHK